MKMQFQNSRFSILQLFITLTPQEIEKKIENLYNRFKMMLLNKDENSQLKVTAILQRINDTLKANGSRFLTGKFYYLRPTVRL